MTNKLTNPVNMVILVAIVVFFVFLITSFGAYLYTNPNSELSTGSLSYISEMSTGNQRLGFNTTLINADNIEGALDESEVKNQYDFSLDFVFGKSKANVISDIVNIVFSLPEVVISKIFRLPMGGFNLFISIVNWLWRIFIFIGIVAFIRGRI